MTTSEAATLAATLTPSQRRAVQGADAEGRLPAGTAVGTAVALMKRGVSGPREFRNADAAADDPGVSGNWLSELGHEVRNALQAETESVPAVPVPVPEANEAVPARSVVPPLERSARSDSGSVTVAAVEAAWSEIQKRNAEVPDVVVISGGTSRVVRRKGREYVEVKWGTFHANQWTTDGGQRHELLVSGECLGRGALFTLETILHEAAHGLAYVRGVKDTSRAGKYHNKRFVTLAAELGLVWPEGTDPDTSFGFSDMKIADATADDYADAVAALEKGRRAWRDLVGTDSASATGDGPEGDEDADDEPEAAPKPKSKNARPKAVCGCEAEAPIWLSRRVLKAGTVGCLECGQPYRAADPEDED